MTVETGVNEQLLKDAYVSRWIMKQSKERTRRNYLLRLRQYLEYIKKTPRQVIDEAIEDQRMDVRERRDVVSISLIGFLNHMKKNHTEESSRSAVMAIRSFYATFDVRVRMNLGDSEIKFRRRKLVPKDVRKMLDHCLSIRDRAVILVMYQSGIDVSTLTGLTYGDVARGLEESEHPLRLDLLRKKTHTRFNTYLGFDAVSALKTYLEDLKNAQGIELRKSDPLFFKEYGRKGQVFEPLSRSAVEVMVRDVAKRSGLIKGDEPISDVTPHALRSSFSKILAENGCNDSIIEFWLGHAIGSLGKAYRENQSEEVKQQYLKYEPYLSISNGNGNGLKDNVAEIREENQKLLGIVSDLAGRTNALESMNKRLGVAVKSEDKEEVLELRVRNDTQAYAIQNMEKRIEDLEKALKTVIGLTHREDKHSEENQVEK
ncbi:MAG: tyrosine-type recombinase/integrase [Promethearchaeati archaeon SRVP18_Atabeyarchaeia-1]